MNDSSVLRLGVYGTAGRNPRRFGQERALKRVWTVRSEERTRSLISEWHPAVEGGRDKNPAFAFLE